MSEKRPETYAEFESMFIDLMHQALQQVPAAARGELRHNVFSSRMQAAYCYCNDHLLLAQGGVSAHDSLECTFKSMKSILCTFHDNLPEDIRVETFGHLLANLNAAAVEILSGTARFARARSKVVLTAEGTGRA